MRFFTTLLPSKEFNQGHFDALASQFRDFGHILQAVPQIHEFPGYWSKMNAFAPENAGLRPFVHVDLDILVLEDPEPLLHLDPSHLWMLSEFKIEGPQGSIMVVPDAAVTYAIWNEFQQHGPDHWLGDQLLVGSYPYSVIQDEVSGILSYKVNCHRSYPPTSGTKIVVFHGFPRPWESMTKRWARQHYDKHVGTQ